MCVCVCLCVFLCVRVHLRVGTAYSSTSSCVRFSRTKIRELELSLEDTRAKYEAAEAARRDAVDLARERAVQIEALEKDLRVAKAQIDQTSELEQIKKETYVNSGIAPSPSTVYPFFHTLVFFGACSCRDGRVQSFLTLCTHNA